MPAKKKRNPIPKNGERKNGEAPGFNVGKNATIREILAEARTFMTPEEYRDFSRKPKGNLSGGILKVRKGATMKEIYAAARKNFTAWDLQWFTQDHEFFPAEDLMAEMEEIHRLTQEELNENTTPARRQEIRAILKKIMGHDVTKANSFNKRHKRTRKKKAS